MEFLPEKIQKLESWKSTSRKKIIYFYWIKIIDQVEEEAVDSKEQLERKGVRAFRFLVMKSRCIII